MEVYVHLGIHKTGSSFLQKVFFPHYTDNVCFLDRAKLASFKEYVLNEDDFEFEKTKALELFNEAVGANQNCNKVVISDEEFYGNPYLAVLDRKRNFDRLYEIFGKSLKVILFLRNQQNLLNSLYNQYVKTGGSASFKAFLNYKKYPLNFRVPYLLYDKYVDYLIKTTGVDKVKIYLYEDFLENKSDVLNDMNKFITNKSNELLGFSNFDKKVNASLNNGNIPVLRFLNKFTKSLKSPFLLLHINAHKLIRKLFLNLRFGLSPKRNYILTSLTSIDDVKASNTRLKKCCTRLELQKYGYLILDDVT
ncbi:MAG: hypothetical protein Wins2KO_28480 [Winogradskyella sp.]